MSQPYANYQQQNIQHYQSNQQPYQQREVQQNMMQGSNYQMPMPQLQQAPPHGYWTPFNPNIPPPFYPAVPQDNQYQTQLQQYQPMMYYQNAQDFQQNQDQYRPTNYGYYSYQPQPAQEFPRFYPTPSVVTDGSPGLTLQGHEVAHFQDREYGNEEVSQEPTLFEKSVMDYLRRLEVKIDHVFGMTLRCSIQYETLSGLVGELKSEVLGVRNSMMGTLNTTGINHHQIDIKSNSARDDQSTPLDSESTPPNVCASEDTNCLKKLTDHTRVHSENDSNDAKEIHTSENTGFIQKPAIAYSEQPIEVASQLVPDVDTAVTQESNVVSNLSSPKCFPSTISHNQDTQVETLVLSKDIPYMPLGIRNKRRMRGKKERMNPEAIVSADKSRSDVRQAKTAANGANSSDLLVMEDDSICEEVSAILLQEGPCISNHQTRSSENCIFQDLENNLNTYEEILQLSKDIEQIPLLLDNTPTVCLKEHDDIEPTTPHSSCQRSNTPQTSSEKSAECDNAIEPLQIEENSEGTSDELLTTVGLQSKKPEKKTKKTSNKKKSNRARRTAAKQQAKREAEEAKEAELDREQSEREEEAAYMRTAMKAYLKEYQVIRSALTANIARRVGGIQREISEYLLRTDPLPLSDQSAKGILEAKYAHHKRENNWKLSIGYLVLLENHEHMTVQEDLIFLNAHSEHMDVLEQRLFSFIFDEKKEPPGIMVLQDYDHKARTELSVEVAKYISTQPEDDRATLFTFYNNVQARRHVFFREQQEIRNQVHEDIGRLRIAQKAVFQFNTAKGRENFASVKTPKMYFLSRIRRYRPLSLGLEGALIIISHFTFFYLPDPIFNWDAFCLMEICHRQSTQVRLTIDADYVAMFMGQEYPWSHYESLECSMSSVKLFHTDHL